MLLAILLHLPLAAATPAQPVDPALERIAVVGASASAGWGLRGEWGVSLSMEDFVEATLREPAQRVLGLGDGFFFMDPVMKGPKQIEKAAAIEPTLVVALDFLFWFGYGEVPDDYRLRRLDEGLRELDTFECPILVGDLPDMSPATKGTSPIGPLIFPAQIPAPEVLEQLNERIHAWASERERVVLVPLAAFVERTRTARRLELLGNVWEGDLGERFTQADLLHPTIEGTTVMLLLAYEAALRVHPDWAEHLVVATGEVEGRLREAHADALERAAKRAQRKAERAAAREANHE